MTQKFDIPINLTVIAKDEKEAESFAIEYLRDAYLTLNNVNIEEYELLEFIPSELSQSCCC